MKPAVSSEHGFTLIEALVATTIMMLVTAGVFTVLNPSTGLSQTQPEVADMQQRLRLGADRLKHDLVNAGAGSYSGLNDTFQSQKARSLSNYFAPILPFIQSSDSNDDGPQVFKTNRITIIYVPSTASQTTLRNAMASPSETQVQVNVESGCPLTTQNGQVPDPLCGFKAEQNTKAVIYDGTGAFDTFVVTAVNESTNNLNLQHAQQGTFSKAYAIPSRITEISYHAYFLNTTTKQLMHDDGLGTALPVLDNVVGLDFEYYGDPAPPAFLKPNSADYSTTYGPAPPGLGTNKTVGTWPLEENCTWTIQGTGPNKAYVPRLATMGPGGNGLVKLTASNLTDGPWCPDGSNTNRYDADLLRVRKVRVTIRLQTGNSALRTSLTTGPNALFTNAGTATSASKAVPDQSIRFDVAPRNMNLGR